VILVLLLMAIGLSLSAFFSGSETGFFRVTQVRLLVEAMAGSRIARGLLWAVYHPTVFVATSLIGNNVANWLVTFAAVMGTHRLAGGDNPTAELVAPLVLTPLVFIYGELLPKSLFFDAPFRLLMRCGPAYLVAMVLFAPATALLWLVGKLLGIVSQKSPQEIRLVLARRELANVLEQGHEAGILHPSQQGLVQGTFALAGQPVRQFATPAGRYARITTNTSKEDVLRLAKRQHRAMIPVEEPRGKRRLVGYVRVIDLLLDPGSELPPLRPLVVLKTGDTYLAALERLLAADRALGHVVDEDGATLGFVTARQLTSTLLKEHEA
jgi:CBS domain containing-hemolysin-like protein